MGKIGRCGQEHCLFVLFSCSCSRSLLRRSHSRLASKILEPLVFIFISRAEASRKPKLFYVTTKSSTSILSTFSICFVSSDAAPVTCKRRKKRAGLNSEPLIEGEQEKINIAPSEVQSGLDSDQEQRNAKFLVYWLTTTSTSFSTVYSATSTLASLKCTPANFPYALCGK